MEKENFLVQNIVRKPRQKRKTSAFPLNKVENQYLSNMDMSEEKNEVEMFDVDVFTFGNWNKNQLTRLKPHRKAKIMDTGKLNTISN